MSAAGGARTEGWLRLRQAWLGRVIRVCLEADSMGELRVCTGVRQREAWRATHWGKSPAGGQQAWSWDDCHETQGRSDIHCPLGARGEARSATTFLSLPFLPLQANTWVEHWLFYTPSSSLK